MRVLLIEDTIVRSTTMQTLLNLIRTVGGAKEIHVRVACPPIIAPCFYGIDMSTISELFAPKFRLTVKTPPVTATVLSACVEPTCPPPDKLSNSANCKS